MTLKLETRPVLFGAAAGAIALLVYGVAWGGWLDSGTADSAVKQQSEASSIAALVPACVAKFNADADVAVHAAALKAASSQEQGPYVEKGGWANVPGTITANSALARACADALTKVTQ
jgi:hypothetical protein